MFKKIKHFNNIQLQYFINFKSKSPYVKTKFFNLINSVHFKNNNEWKTITLLQNFSHIEVLLQQLNFTSIEILTSCIKTTWVL